MIKLALLQTADQALQQSPSGGGGSSLADRHREHHRGVRLRGARMELVGTDRGRMEHGELIDLAASERAAVNGAAEMNAMT